DPAILSQAVLTAGPRDELPEPHGPTMRAHRRIEPRLRHRDAPKIARQPFLLERALDHRPVARRAPQPRLHQRTTARIFSEVLKISNDLIVEADGQIRQREPLEPRRRPRGSLGAACDIT